jgi:hypothetical protein
MTKRAWILVVCSFVAACEKDGGKASGALSSADLDLFKSLPSGAPLVFGGNMMKVQNFMTSAFGEAMAQMMGKGMTSWNECFAAFKDVKIAGELQLGTGKSAEMRMVMSGIALDDVAKCADKAGFKAAPDADNKFITVDAQTPMMNLTYGYLKLANGALYTRQSFMMMAGPTIVPGRRADLENDIATLKGTVADDKGLQDLIAKVDRSKTLWFAGTGAGTPIADKVGEAFGSFDVSPGMSADVTVQLKNESDAKSAEDAVAQARKMSDKLPGELKSIVDGLDFTRKGDRVHFAIKVTDAQLKTLVGTGMLGGLGRPKRHHAMPGDPSAVDSTP